MIIDDVAVPPLETRVLEDVSNPSFRESLCFSEGCRRACENFRERKWRWWQCRCTGTRSIGSAYEYCAKRMWPQAVPWPSDAIVALATRWQPGCRAQPDEGDGAPVAAARFQPASGVRPPHGKTARGGSAPTGASGSAAQARVLLIPASPSPSSWPRSSAASASPSSASFLIEVSFPPPSSPSTSPSSAQMPSRPTSDAPPRHAGRSGEVEEGDGREGGGGEGTGGLRTFECHPRTSMR